MRLFALAGTRDLGEKIARHAAIELDPLEERDFEGGEHKARPLVSVRNEDVYILQTLGGAGGGSPAERLLRLLFLIACCRDNGAARVTAVTPYLAFMRKDQQTKPRDPVNSRYVVELLEAMGADVIVTLDPHNRSAFQNAVRRRNVTLDTRALFAARIEALAETRPLVLVSPDSGGMKRAQLLREALEALSGRTAKLAIMEKRRSDDVVSGDLFAGDLDGADAMIVDDIVATGGTLLRTAEACRARGAVRVHAFATHYLDVPGSTVSTSPLLDGLIVTDSLPFREPAGASAGKLSVVSCAPLIAEAIQRLHGGGSITRLLNPWG